MYRIDNSSNSTTLPAPTAAGVNPHGYFIDKNPALGIEGTVVPAEFLNMIQEELAHLIEDANGGNTTTDKSSRTQVKEAILTMMSNSGSGFQPGMMMDWPDDTELPDGGWDWADGGELSRVDNSRLFARIGTKFGIGDGVTTFNKPDRRGRMALGQDNMGGNHANRVTAASTGGSNAGTLGGVGGFETDTLTIAKIPAHDHPTVDFSTSGSGASNGSGNGNVATVTGSTGGGEAHNNMSPWIAIPVVIKL